MKRWVHFTWLVAILASLGLYAVAIWFGELNQDEGWYLYAGKLVAEGQHPFIDFASTQGPVMAYVYALSQPLVRLWGVAGGRIFTAILGFATALCAARLAYRVSRSSYEMPAVSGLRPNAKSPKLPSSPSLHTFSALIAFSLIGLNLYHIYFTALVKTYSLAGLLVVLGFLALEKALRGRIVSQSSALILALFSFISAALFALAAGVRFSSGILLPTVWLSLVYLWLRGGRRRSDAVCLIGFLLGGSLVLLSIYMPFMVLAPESLKFGLLEYHAGRVVDSVPILLAYKAGFLIRLVGSYFPLLVLMFGCWVLGVRRWTLAPSKAHQSPAPKLGTSNPELGTPFPHLLYASLIMVTLVHLSTVFPYDDYQVFIMPLLAVVVGSGLSILVCRFFANATSSSHFSYPLLAIPLILILLAHSVSSPLLQGWLLAERDRIWWPLRADTSLQSLQNAAQAVQSLATSTSEPGTRHESPQISALLLTQDTYLAVETGLNVPKGMELGPFCYFPNMAEEKAKACHVLNRAMMGELLTTSEAPIAAFSGYGLSIQCPEISQLPVDEHAKLWEILESRYNQSVCIESFGQAGTTLRILTKKQDP